MARETTAPSGVTEPVRSAPAADADRPWKIAFVDDDKTVHLLTRLALAGYTFRGRPLQILSEYSGEGARRLLREDPDIALVLLDVVMETEHAGLDLVRYIRDELNNSLVRIILRTGQPGQAPEQQVVSEYDINDYKEKAELVGQKLITAVTSALRAWHDLRTIQALSNSNESLERMVGERTRELERTGQTLQRSQALLAEAQRIAGIGNFELDLVSGAMTWSEQLYRIFGVAQAAAAPGLQGLLDAAAPEARETLNATIAAALAQSRRYEIEYRLARMEGGERFVRQQGEVHCDAGGAPLRLVGIVEDVTERRSAEETMRKLSLAVEQTADSVMITDRAGRIEYVNAAFSAMTGYAPAEAIGQTPRMLRSDAGDESGFARLEQSLLTGEVFSGVLVRRRKDGSTYHESVTFTPQRDASGAITHIVATGRDVTESMQARERIEHLAHHDALTGLPNRILLADRLQQALARAKRNERGVAVVFLDLDRFKVINDTLGHDAGDALLRSMAERLVSCVRKGDTVARLGGDEFALVLGDIAEREDAAVVARKIVESMKAPLKALERDLFVTTSVGISLYPEDGNDGVTLLKHADAAMYDAKSLGRNNFQFHTASNEAESVARLDLETNLRRALAQKEFFLLYQPVLDALTGRTVCREALLRWRHPDGQILPPAEFIPLLEETGMIVEVGDWVLEAACSETRALERIGVPACRIAVNISPRQVRQAGFVERVAAILRRTGLQAEMLELEITESTLVDDLQSTTETLRRLHELGVRLSIDDFGTGYSSLYYIGRLPFSALKIDSSFVSEVPGNAESAAVVAAVISLAQAMGMDAVAEGVATEEQIEFVRKHGCHLVQGNLLSPPLSATEFASFAADFSQAGPPPRLENAVADRFRAQRRGGVKYA